MRIVSLVPAATEIACALGAGDSLVAVTHDCDHPAFVRELPRVTRSAIPGEATSAKIDAQVREAAERGESTFHLDEAALAAARPGVILGQTLCAVCAITLEQLPEALRASPTVVPLEAGSLEGIFADIARVAEVLGRSTAGARLVDELRARLARVADTVRERARPRVAALEWLDPPFNAGHWVPEQIDIAGGTDVLGNPGARSREIGWEEVIASRPDVALLMPCGFDAERAAREAAALSAVPEWSRLRSQVRDAYALDGNAYFSRPGPRVVDGVELLASLLHPGTVSRPADARVIPVGQSPQYRSSTQGSPRLW